MTKGENRMNYGFYFILGLYILLILSIIIHILVGIIKGRRYSLYALISIVIFYALYFLTMNSVSKATMNVHIPFIFSRFGYDNINTLLEFSSMIVNQNMDNILIENPEFVYAVEAITQIVVKIFYFIILALFYSIISAITYQFIKKRNLYKESKYVKLEKKNHHYKEKHNCDKEKYVRKMEKMEVNKDYKKRRFAGGLISGLRGVLCCFLTLCFINSIVNVVPDLNTILIADKEKNGDSYTLYDYIIEMYPEAETALEIVQTYKESTLNKSTKVIQINGETLDNIVLDAILSGDFSGTPLEIRGLLQMFTTLGIDAFILTNGFDMKSVQLDNLSKDQQKRAQRIINTLSDNQFVIHVFPIAISYALSMEKIQNQLKEKNIDLTLADFENIDWKSDMKTIATLIEKVYALEQNVTKIDFLGTTSSPEELEIISQYVNDILQELSQLTILNTAIKVGIQFAINTEALLPYKDDIINALTDVIWSEEIVNVGDIYSAYMKLAIGVLFKKENEDEEKINVLTFLTQSIGSSDNQYTTLIDTIFASQFISEIFPNVMEVAFDKLFQTNPQMRSLINLQIIGQNGWENELNCIIQLIKEFSNHGQEPFQDFIPSLKQISYISTATILQSQLLSDAMIRLLINSVDESQTPVIPELRNFLDMPDELKYISLENTFNYQWYDSENQYGELHIMIEVLKNFIGSIENLKDPLASLNDVLASLNLTKLNDAKMNSIMDSKVFHYSISKTLKKTNILLIPDEILDSNGIIQAKELENILSILSDVIDLSPLLVKVEQTNTTDKKHKEAEYITKIDLQNKRKILEIFAALYDKKTDDTTKLKTVFSSTILRATISDVVAKLNDAIIIPQTITDEMTCKQSSIAVLQTDEMTSLFKSFIQLGLDNFVDNEGNIVANMDTIAKKIIKDNDDSFLDSQILHATISHQLLNLNTTIIIPDSLITKKANVSFISRQELSALLNIFQLFEIDENQTLEQWSNSFNVNQLLDLDIQKILQSKILRATISKELFTHTDVLTIPESAYGETEGSFIFISATELETMFQAIKVLDLNLNFENENLIAMEDILRLDSTQVDTALSSSIVHATLSKYICELSKEAVMIPQQAKIENTELLKVSEIQALFASLKALDMTNLDNLSNQLNIEMIKNLDIEQVNTILSSKIIHATLSIEITKQSSAGTIVVPNSVYSVKDMDVSYISEEEIYHLLSALKTLKVPENQTLEQYISTLDISFISSFTEEEFGKVLDSTILHATVSKKIIDNRKYIVIPASIIDKDESNEMIIRMELEAVFHAMQILDLKENQTLDNYISNFNPNSICDFNEQQLEEILQSKILHAVVSDKIMAQVGIVVPNSVKYLDTKDKDITYIQIEELQHVLNALLALDLQDSSFDMNQLSPNKIAKLDEAKVTTILQSKIVHAAFSKQIINQTSSITIPEEFIQNEDNVQYLDRTEIQHLLKAIQALGIDENTSFDSFASKLSMKSFAHFTDEQLDTIFLSRIAHLTISDTVSGQGANIVIPVDAYEDNGTTITSSELKNIVKGLRELNIENENFNEMMSSFPLSQFTSLNETSLQQLFNSKILHATISHILLSQENIVIPEDVKNGVYIIQEEMIMMKNALSCMSFANDNMNQLQLNVNDILALEDNQIDTILSSRILCKNFSVKIKENIQNANYQLPKVQVKDAQTQKDVQINYVDNDIDKEEISHFIQAIKGLYGNTFDFTTLSELDYSVFLDSPLSDETLRVIVSSHIISYNIGLTLENENQPNGILDSVLIFPENLNWFYKQGEYEGDLYDLLHSLNRIYSNASLRDLFGEIRDKTNSYNISNFKNRDLCDYLTNSRVLIHSVENILQSLAQKKENNQIELQIDLTKQKEMNDIQKKQYYRGNDIIDGELYKFIAAIEAVNRLETYTDTSKEEVMYQDILIILDSDIAANVVEKDVLSEENMNAVNLIRKLKGQEKLEKPNPFVEGVERETFLKEFIHTWLESAENLS